MTTRVHISEPHDFSCLRPGPFGNPYSHKEGTLALYKVDTVEEAVEEFKRHLESNKEIQRMCQELLKGKRLACVCKKNSKWCHVQIIVDFIEKNNTLMNLFGE